MAKAVATGRTARDPARFRNRKEPISKGPLGDPPKWMNRKEDRLAWSTFADELPWLNHSHRSLVEIASILRGRLMTGDEFGIKAATLLRQCLGQMGATPADSSKIQMPDDPKDADPSDKYF